MKIVHIASLPNGAPWMIAIAREQKALGHDVAVIIPSLDGNIAPALHRTGIEAYAGPVDGLVCLPISAHPIADPHGAAPPAHPSRRRP